MKYLGFERHTQGRVSYWHLAGEGHPVVFFHGIGVGLAPYYQVMRKLMTLGRPLYVAEIPEATMSIGTSMPFNHGVPISVQEVLTTWDGILLSEKKYSIVGHSYGTFLAAWFLEARRTRILNCCMVDPVSIMLHHADVCDRFLYGGMSPRAQKIGKSQKSLFMQWLVREEAGIVLTLMRNFWWYKNTAWLEDLSPAKSVVLLGLADEYAAVDKIVGGIEEFNKGFGSAGAGAEEEEEEEEDEGKRILLKTYKGVPHGLFLFHKRMQDDMLEALQRK
jgi:pimeloyl-ACP methyl ester carboxylesterase